MMAKRVIISLDPGTVTLGFAAWNAKAVHGTKTPQPIAAFAYNLAGSLKGSPEQNALRLGGYVADYLDRKEWVVEQVVCEQMEFRSNAVGMAAIADVLNVAFACGVFAQLAKSRRASYRPAPVSKWKGQLSKDQVCRRIVKKWEGDVPDCMSAVESPSHDWDAAGIGLWALGFFE